MIRVGTAGWSVPRGSAGFLTSGTQLERYAAHFDAVEINSSFHRPHRPATYARWASNVPSGFRFSVKVPKLITHERRLVGCADAIERFAGEVDHLGPTLGAVLVQLPPGLAFAAAAAEAAFAALSRMRVPIVCEPRHPSWFTAACDRFLADCGVARAAADPVPAPGADAPGGWRGIAYIRWHGSPRTYYSDYDHASLVAVSASLQALARGGVPAWCIFDNTALGHALGNALTVARMTRVAAA